ncbi:MAG: hypothetical protein HEP71_31960 [Roseivirga sp.]|nr:hypothetical protein [Roseivirga sp.]
MDSKSIYTLNLKLKRHNLKFDLDEQSQTLVLGRAKDNVFKLAFGLGLIIVGVAAIVVVILILDLDGRLRYTGLIGLPAIVAGGIEIKNYFKKKIDNKYRKIITPEKFCIERRKGGPLEIESANISRVLYAINKAEDGLTAHGYLLPLTQ